MKKLFLASNASNVLKGIADELLPKKKDILFIKTASEVYGEDPEWLEVDRNALKKEGFVISDYTLTGKKAKHLKEELKEHDIIFMSGGNTYYLLEKIQQSKTLNVIREAVETGMLYIGSSAGSVIAGPDIRPVCKLDNIREAPNLKGFEGLALVDFVVVPHWGYEKYLDEQMEGMKENYLSGNKFILLTDYQYVYVKNDVYKIVDIRKDRKK